MFLIQNGFLYTMAAQGAFEGDILVDGDRILRVEPRIDTDSLDLEKVIDAKGLWVLPGLIDAHMHLVRASADDEKNERDAIADALSSGVTTQALWPEGGSGPCLVRHGACKVEQPASPLFALRQEGYTDAALRNTLSDARENGRRVAMEVYGEAALRRILTLGQDVGCPLVLTHLTGCADMAEDIARTGWEVIMGACVLRTGTDYALTARLHQLGVPLALTSDYPATRLHHLPLSAGLCVRGGMERHAALRAITIDAARLLRVDASCGSIEPGKRADFTLFDGDPLMLASARIMTISGGQTV